MQYLLLTISIKNERERIEEDIRQWRKKQQNDRKRGGHGRRCSMRLRNRGEECFRRRDPVRQDHGETNASELLHYVL